MPISYFLQQVGSFEMQAFQSPEKKFQELKKTHVPFSGTPVRHPDDPDKVVLIPDPCSTNTFYYEFKAKDVSYMENLPSITGLEGETVVVVRLWVRMGSVALRCVPFVVQDTMGPA